MTRRRTRASVLLGAAILQWRHVPTSAAARDTRRGARLPGRAVRTFSLGALSLALPAPPEDRAASPRPRSAASSPRRWSRTRSFTIARDGAGAALGPPAAPDPVRDPHGRGRRRAWPWRGTRRCSWPRSCSPWSARTAMDAGPFSPLEVAILPDTVPPQRQTRAFAWFNVVGFLPAALGALAAGQWLRVAGAGRRRAGRGASRGPRGRTPRAASCWRSCTPGFHADGPDVPPPAHAARSLAGPAPLAERSSSSSRGCRPSTRSPAASWPRACSSTGSTSASASGPTCSAALLRHQLLSAVSFLAAARLAERVGLLHTMVFTHVLSNLLLAAVAHDADLPPGGGGPPVPPPVLADGRADAAVLHDGAGGAGRARARRRPHHGRTWPGPGDLPRASPGSPWPTPPSACRSSSPAASRSSTTSRCSRASGACRCPSRWMGARPVDSLAAGH